VFIDGSATIKEEASFNVWQKRKIYEINEGKKKVPACLGILIGDIFRKNNVKVHYTKFDELIDVIASYDEYYKQIFYLTTLDL